MSPSKISNISPDSVVNSVTTRTKTNPVSATWRHRISDLVGVLRRFWEFPNPEIGFRPLPSHKSKRAGEIEPFRTIWVSLPESRLFQGLINRFYYLSDCATGYKWTVTCVLVYEIWQENKLHVSEQNIPEYSSHRDLVVIWWYLASWNPHKFTTIGPT